MLSATDSLKGMQASPSQAANHFNDLLRHGRHRRRGGGSDADSRVALTVEFVEIRHSRCDVYMTPAVSESGPKNSMWKAFQQLWQKVRPTADIRC